MPFTTRLTTALSIRVPIIQGGMQWIGLSPLASAVSNAGSLGILTALTQPSPSHLADEIRHDPRADPLPLRRQPHPPPGAETPRTTWPTPAPSSTAASASSKPRGLSPGPVIALLKAAGCVVIPQVHHDPARPRGREARCRFPLHRRLRVRGSCGRVGHHEFASCWGGRGRCWGTRRSWRVGGLRMGRGWRRRWRWGAEGINMGTRFMCTIEAPIHVNVKKAIVQAGEGDTELVLRSFRNTTRLYGNKVAKQAVEIERDKGKEVVFEDVRELVGGVRGRRVFESGDVEEGVWTAGQVIGLIHDVPSCAELVGRIEREAEEAVRRVGRLMVREGERKGNPKVGYDVNNPQAEVWAIGQSKL